MSWFQVRLSGESAGYRPGDTLTGEAEWDVDDPTAPVYVQLCWTTEGTYGGGAGPVTVLHQTFEGVERQGKRDFRFELPAGPWTFQGKLFSVCWFVEVGESPFMNSRADFVLGPEGRPVVAASVAPDQAPGESRRK